MNKHTARFTVATLFAALAAAPAAAQVTLTPRAMGMGGAYVAAARGNEALFLNPANLGLAGTPHWSLAFPQIALGGNVLGPGFEDVPDIANFDDLDPARRDEILGAIPAAGAEFRYDLRAPLVALQNGHFAMGVSYGSIGRHTMGKDLAELFFHGYEEGRTDYSVGDTRGSRVSFWDFAAAYGRSIGPVSIGVTGHYIRGGAILNSRLFEPRVDIQARDLQVDYRTVYASGGQGYGVDVGVAIQPVRSVTLSAAVSNAFAKMEWSDELYTRALVLNRADFDAGEYMLLQDRYRTSEEKVDPNATSLSVLQTAEGLFDEAHFPAVLQAGAAWQGSHGTTLSVGYRDQLTTGRLADEWESLAGVGLQQKLPLITVRAGYASNLEQGSMLSGGLTLGVIELGVAKVDHGAALGSQRTGWVGTFGVGVRTRGVLP